MCLGKAEAYESYHSYDGDDNITKTSAQNMNSTTELAPISSLNEAVQPSAESKKETDEEAQYEPGDHDPHTNGNDQINNGGSAWTGGQNNDYEVLPVEQDSHGTGIKEDG